MEEESSVRQIVKPVSHIQIYFRVSSMVFDRL